MNKNTALNVLAMFFENNSGKASLAERALYQEAFGYFKNCPTHEDLAAAKLGGESPAKEEEVGSVEEDAPVDGEAENGS